MSDLVIREVIQNVWTFSKPFARFGIFPVGGRSTAVRLQSGDVWLLASTPLNDETKAKLNELGTVKYVDLSEAFLLILTFLNRYICGADAVHHLFLGQYKKAYPEAKMIGVAPLVEKKKGEFEFDGVYGRDPPGTQYGYEPEVGFYRRPWFADVAFLHAPSKTLIQADLLFNLPAKEQVRGCYGNSQVVVLTQFAAVLKVKVVWQVPILWQLGTHDAISQDVSMECRTGQKVRDTSNECLTICATHLGSAAPWPATQKRLLDGILTALFHAMG
ncbi:hypothetical protein AG1IA_08011 [Rhizoctonia solani AG-1 IA]|uniref:Uncharacterized protein n=1 Tax=Thanatephorus cucumeris (strain AG1-IA) TaxID=983506 RepID=L8WNN8_THACA|nr:hypothetical protein AG1IA_08011 [Rhizoctonia solani AG-1 IA]